MLLIDPINQKADGERKFPSKSSYYTKRAIRQHPRHMDQRAPPDGQSAGSNGAPVDRSQTALAGISGSGPRAVPSPASRPRTSSTIWSPPTT